MALQVHACFRMRFMCVRVCVALRPMLSIANIVVAFVFEDKGKHQSWGWANIEHREKSGSTQRIWVGVGREVHGYQKYFVCCKWMLYDNFLFSQCCSECKSLKEIVQEARFSIDEQSTSFNFRTPDSQPTSWYSQGLHNWMEIWNPCGCKWLLEWVVQWWTDLGGILETPDSIYDISRFRWSGYWLLLKLIFTSAYARDRGLRK